MTLNQDQHLKRTDNPINCTHLFYSDGVCDNCGIPIEAKTQEKIDYKKLCELCHGTGHFYVIHHKERISCHLCRKEPQKERREAPSAKSQIMTLANIKKLNDEELNIKVAEFLGWTDIYRSVYGYIAGYAPNSNHNHHPLPIPHYSNDLNTIHEIERIDPNLRNAYISNLWMITGNDKSVNFWTEYNLRGLFACIYATARQKAEAFVLTMTICHYKNNNI